MIPDDVFDRQIAQLAEAATGWAAPFHETVRITIDLAPTYLRLAGRPDARGTCLLDLVIDRRRQRLDLEVASETYEDLPLRDMNQLLSLFDAAAVGAIMTRRWQRGLSGHHVATETRFDGHATASAVVGAQGWALRQFVPGRSARDLADALALDKKYTPWRR